MVPSPKQAALTNNASPIPAISTITPATKGAKIRVPLNTAELSEFALRMSSRSTRSGTIAMLAGMTKPWIAPSIVTATYTCHMAICSIIVSVANATRVKVTAAWLIIKN